MPDDWTGLSECDIAELELRLEQVTSRLRIGQRVSGRCPTADELHSWSGWICYHLQDWDAYREHAAEKLVRQLADSFGINLAVRPAGDATQEPSG